MSKRKTRKQKIKLQEQRTVANKEMKLLKKDILDLQKKIEEQEKITFKEGCIKNLKIFGSICNFSAPLVISSSVIIGVLYLLGAGLPFVKDDFNKYKRYSLDYETDGEIESNEHYEYKNSDELEDCELTISFPTILNNDNNYYERTTRYYDEDTLDSVELYEAILSEDMEYINANYTEYDEEKIVTDYLPSNADDYIIKANLDFYVSDDSIPCEESDFDNNLVTIMDIIGSFGLFAWIHHIRNFRLFSSIEKLKENYKHEDDYLDCLNKEFEEKNEKLLSLTKGGNKNVR